MIASLFQCKRRVWFAFFFCSLLLSRTFAQAPPGPAITTAGSANDQQPQTNSQQQPQTQQQTKTEESVYPDLLDGTLSAAGDLEEENSPHTSDTSFLRNALESYFDWKESVKEQYGFSYAASWGVLWQNYTNSRIAQPNAVGSKVTINLAYDLFNHNKPSAFSIDMAVEDRRPLGTNLPPLQADLGGGSAVPTAATWGQFDIGITQLYVRQSLFKNHFQYTVGKIFAPNYVDPYPFFDDNRQFLSQQFSTNTTIQSPLRGFGGVAAWFPTESGLYLKGGMLTSNSSDTGSTVADFFVRTSISTCWKLAEDGLARTGTPIQVAARPTPTTSTLPGGTGTQRTLAHALTASPHPAPAMLADGGNCLNGALKAVEGMVGTGRDQLERLVILVAANFAFRHITRLSFVKSNAPRL